MNNKMIEQVKRRTELALNRFGRNVQRVKIRIVDTNGPKSSVDVHCVVVMNLPAGGEVVTQGMGEDIISTLNNCLSRADRNVGRLLGRRRNTQIRMHRRKTVTENDLHIFGTKQDEYTV